MVDMFPGFQASPHIPKAVPSDASPGTVMTKLSEILGPGAAGNWSNYSCEAIRDAARRTTSASVVGALMGPAEVGCTGRCTMSQ